MIIELLEVTYSIKIPKPPNYLIKFIDNLGRDVCYLVEEFEYLLDAMLKIHEIAACQYSGWAVPVWMPTKQYYHDRTNVIRWRLINKFSIQDQKLTVLYTMNPEDKFQ